MKRLINFGSVGLVLVGAIAAGGEAFAQLPDVFIQQVFTNGQPSGFRIGIKGSPRTQVPVTLSPQGGVGQQRTRAARVNACGFTVLNNASTLGDVIGFGGQNVTLSTLSNNSIVGAPDCVNGVPSFPLPNTPGQFVYRTANNSLLITGVSPSRVIDITYQDSSPISRFVSTNQCGFGLTNAPSGYLNVAVGSNPVVDAGQLPISEYRCVNGFTFKKADATQISNIPASFRYESDIWYKDAPFTQISTIFEGQPNVRSATSDRCGGLLLGSATNPVSGDVKINGISIGDVSSLPIAERPACRLSGGVYSFSVEPTGNIKLPTGQVYVTTVTGLSLQGAQPNKLGDRSIVSVEQAGTRTVNVRTNACGLATIRSTTSAPITASTQFTKQNGSTQAFSDLPEFAAPRCTGSDVFVQIP